MRAASVVVEQTEEADCVPFLKWAGGKRWLFRQHRHLFPTHISRLIDPFLGGGSSFFMLKPDAALVSDSNSDLIATYEAVRDCPRQITLALKNYHDSHNKEFYYSTRSQRPSDPIQLAAWFLYLNRTCWNGLYRVNLKGQFNVPKGTKTRVYLAEDELDAASGALQRVSLKCVDFEETLAKARAGDVVFADPPYFEENESLRFVKYNARVFGWPDQLRLRDSLISAARRGARCYITNSNHDSLVRLYNTTPSHVLSRQLVVAAAASARRNEKELLIEISAQ